MLPGTSNDSRKWDGLKEGRSARERHAWRELAPAWEVNENRTKKKQTKQNNLFCIMISFDFLFWKPFSLKSN